MGEVFVNYRRKDHPLAPEWVYGKRVSVFGREAVFKDIDNIPPGANFGKCLDAALGESARFGQIDDLE